MKFSSNFTFTLAQPSPWFSLSMTTNWWISCALSLLACHVSLAVSTNEAGGEPQELFIFSEICALKKMEGPCKAIKDRFYFDIDTGRCEAFAYGGCGGNANNFETLEECALTCLVSAEKSPCHLEEAPGPCRGLVTRYFYDSKTQECKRFFYGGCFGNANNFKSMVVCQAKCQNQGTTTPATKVDIVQPTNESSIKPLTGIIALSQPQVHLRKSQPDFSPPEICITPVDRGTCDGAERRFAYNPKTDRCHVFRYSGCGGNANSFSHKRHCMKTCMNITSGAKMIRIRKKNLNNISFRAI